MLKFITMFLFLNISNGVKVKSQPKKMLEIELNQTEFNNDKEVKSVPMSEDLVVEISEIIPSHTQGSLMQTSSVQVESDLTNLKNMAYDGQFWFGEPSQKMNVIYDTGSSVAWLFSETCGAKCPKKNKTYLNSQSKGFKTMIKGQQLLGFAQGQVGGHPSTDRACFSESDQSCIHNLQFLDVVKAENLDSVTGSGLIGLAPVPNNAEQNKLLKNPLNGPTPGFVNQLLHSPEYKRDFEPQFSFYLSSSEQEKGKMIFGGYNLKYAKKGSTEKDIFWAKQSRNPYYWGVNADNVSLGSVSVVSKPQQLILDNGMSLAMAPEKSFAYLVIGIYRSSGISCMVSRKGCLCEKEQYEKLEPIKFNVIADETGKTKVFEMPKESYMDIETQENGATACKLLIKPWKFEGPGAKKANTEELAQGKLADNQTEEYWILGVQFLRNYYTIYDFHQKKIGLVESKTAKL